MTALTHKAKPISMLIIRDIYISHLNSSKPKECAKIPGKCQHKESRNCFTQFFVNPESEVLSNTNTASCASVTVPMGMCA